MANTKKTSSFLSVYLQDHHAGATAGLELARRAAQSNRGTSYGDELEVIVAEIAEDVEALERAMTGFGIEPSRLKDGGAWIGEKLGRLKRNGTWISYSPLSRLVELEGLVLGVTGKLALWEALETRGDSPPGVDLDRLAERAHEQRIRLEALRRRAARDALGAQQAPAA